MSDRRHKLSSLKGYKIVDIKKSVRHGNCFEIRLHNKDGVITRMIVSCDWIFDANGNFFDTNNIEYVE